MASVRIESVSKAFGGVAAMHAITLDIASGSFLTLLGPSGCGKTTTLRSIAGLVRPDSGRILIGDQDVTALAVHRRDLAMVFQSHALFAHMNARDNVAFGLRMRGVAAATRRERAEQALALVGLQGLGDRLAHQLSGGQQQRVAIARALVIDPRVLLLDEPFGALDRKLRETMQQELRALTRRLGITAIFVTHDQEEALILSDQIAVMNAGHIEQLGPPALIFERPATRFVADFMGVHNFFDAELDPCDADGSARAHLGAEHFVWPGAPRVAQRQRLALALRPERWRLVAPGSGGLQALVEETVYAGTMIRYRIAHPASGHRFEVHALSVNGPDSTVWTPGSKVALIPETQSLIVLS